MKVFFLIILFTLGACSHHDKKVEHHHHDTSEVFGKNCAYSIARGDLEKIGNHRYQLSHRGEVYYFSSLKKLNEFKIDIENNIKNAKNNWDQRR